MRFRPIHPAIFVLAILLSCDESLQPRQDPTDLFTVLLQADQIYSLYANGIYVNLVATNRFDETLNDRAGIAGTLKITSSRDSTVHKTFSLGPKNLVHGKYNPLYDSLTIDPGDSVILQVYWDYTDDNGQNLSDYFFKYSVDRTCSQRLISQPETFTMCAVGRLYPNLGYAQCNISYAFIQYNIFVGPKQCLPF